MRTERGNTFPEKKQHAYHKTVTDVLTILLGFTKQVDSLRQQLHRPYIPLPPCPCHLQRVALSNTQGSANFFRDHNSAKVIHPANDACCFHFFPLLVMSFHGYCLQEKRYYAAKNPNAEITPASRHGNAEGPAACALQTASPFGCSVGSFGVNTQPWAALRHWLHGELLFFL